MAKETTTTPSTKTYVNTVSGARISGDVYKSLNASMKAKYAIEKKGKGAKTPPEAEK